MRENQRSQDKIKTKTRWTEPSREGKKKINPKKEINVPETQTGHSKRPDLRPWSDFSMMRIKILVL